MTPVLTKRWKALFLPALGLVLLTLAVYGHTVGYGFISNWDDNLYVTDNPDILGFTAHNLVRVFSSSYVGNYAPVHLLSYMLDYQFAGMDPGWFHGVNVGIHIGNGLLYYLLVLRLTGKPFWGFVSATLFLLHPVQVESVAWVTERKNLLAMFFSLGAFHCYLSYRRESGARQKCAYLYSVLLLTLALLAKSIAVIVPCAFVLHDFFLETPRREREMLTDKVPYFVLTALTVGITMITQAAEMGGGRVDYFGDSLVTKTLTMLPVLTRYLQILVWPTNLDAVYLFILKTRPDRETLLALFLVLGLAGAAGYLWRRDRQLCFGFALFFLGLLPVSQIVQISTLMNDRYLYFPMLGAAWMLGGALSRLNDRFPGRVNPATALCWCLIIPAALLSQQRTLVWRDAVALWSDVAAKHPTHKDPRACLAEAYLNAEHQEQALANYAATFALKREFSDLGVEERSLNNAAGLYLGKGAPASALPLLKSLNERFPDYSPGFVTLGDYHRLCGNLPAAEQAYRQALALDPRSAQAPARLASLHPLEVR